jgi:hypothetical protein
MLSGHALSFVSKLDGGRQFRASSALVILQHSNQTQTLVIPQRGGIAQGICCSPDRSGFLGGKTPAAE